MEFNRTSFIHTSASRTADVILCSLDGTQNGMNVVAEIFPFFCVRVPVC